MLSFIVYHFVWGRLGVLKDVIFVDLSYRQIIDFFLQIKRNIKKIDSVPSGQTWLTFRVAEVAVGEEVSS